MDIPWQMPGPDASPREVVYALRARALSFGIFADALAEFDQTSAAVAREEAFQLRCKASVIEAMAELYEELGMKALMWREFEKRMNGTQL